MDIPGSLYPGGDIGIALVAVSPGGVGICSAPGVICKRGSRIICPGAAAHPNGSGVRKAGLRDSTASAQTSGTRRQGTGKAGAIG